MRATRKERAESKKASAICVMESLESYVLNAHYAVKQWPASNGDRHDAYRKENLRLWKVAFNAVKKAAKR